MVQLSKQDIMRDYGLTEEQFNILRDAVNTSAATLEAANPKAKAMIWGFALQQLYDGKSFKFVLDTVKATKE